MYAPVYSIQRLAQLRMHCTGRCETGGIWREVFGGRQPACVVWCAAGGRWQVGYVGRNHDVGQYSSLNLNFWVATMTRSLDALRSWYWQLQPQILLYGGRLNLGGSNYPTWLSQQNLVFVSGGCWEYVYAFDLGRMVMMVMALVMVMVQQMVMVMVMVPKALSPVGWLRECQCQNINRLQPSLDQSFHKLRVYWVVLATGPGLDRKNGSVQFQTRPKTRPADSWRAKPGPVHVNLRVSPRLAGPIDSNLRFCVSGSTFIVPFRYATVNRKISTLVRHGSFSTY